MSSREPARKALQLLPKMIHTLPFVHAAHLTEIRELQKAILSWASQAEARVQSRVESCQTGALSIKLGLGVERLRSESWRPVCARHTG